MLMGNLLIVGAGRPGMATSERESGGRPFGIAHLTVVPANFDPERTPREDGDLPD